MSETTESKSSLVLTLLPLAVLAALVFAGWRMLDWKASNQTNTTPPHASQAAEKPQTTIPTSGRQPE